MSLTPYMLTQLTTGFSGTAALKRRVCPTIQQERLPPPDKPQHAELIGIGVALLDGVIDARHQVLVVEVAPVALDGGREFVAVAGRGAVIDHQHGVARARQHLRVEVEDVAECAVRSTVNVEHGRVGRFAFRRQINPAFDLPRRRCP